MSNNQSMIAKLQDMSALEIAMMLLGDAALLTDPQYSDVLDAIHDRCDVLKAELGL